MKKHLVFPIQPKNIVLIFLQRFIVKKLKKNKTYRFNVVRQIAYVHETREKDFHYIKIRVT